MSTDFQELIDSINKLKREKNAVILAHNYQRPEIYEVADHIGDSLALSILARDTEAEMILFSGVHFMAETAKIINPDKKVVVPHLDAGCPMADMVDVEDLKIFKQKYPHAKVVTYVNSSAAVKAESDVCCTSANAVQICENLDSDQIIFLPDRNLAAYVQRQLPAKKIIAWQGFCPVHNSLTKEYIEKVREDHPKAKVIAHPECLPEILETADHIESTSGMIGAARKDSAEEFFILTECGMVERLQRELPNKKFYGFCNQCFDMKKNTLASIAEAIKNEKPEVLVEPSILKRAKSSFDKMFELMKDE